MTLSHLVGYARCKYNVERETRWQVVILGHGSDTGWRVQLDPTPLLEYLRSKNAHKVRASQLFLIPPIFGLSPH